MPLPLMLGIPWLAGVIAAAFTSLMVWLAQYLTKRLAMVVAAIVLIVGLTVSLFATIESMLLGLSLSVPSNYAVGMALICPSNLSSCVGLMITAKILRYAYDWNVKVIQYKLL